MRMQMIAASFLAAGLGSVALGQAPTFFTGRAYTSSTYTVDTGFIPPDTNGWVGPNHFAELINGRFAVRNKSNGVLVQAISLDSFWLNAGVTPSSFAFDPRIMYDEAAGRWYAASVDNAGGANSFLLAVSASSDPTGAWIGFKIDNDADNSNWADFPMLGYNQDAVYLSANMFTLVGGAFRTAVLVVPKSSLLSGNTAGATLFQDVNSNGTGANAHPVISLDNNAARRLISSYNTGAGTLKFTAITGGVNSPALDTAGGFVSLAARSDPPTADQPGPKQNIETGGSNFKSPAVQMGNLLWAVRTIGVSGNAALEVLRFNATTNALLETVVISDGVGTTDYYYPSIAANELGEVVIGFTSSNNETRFAGSYCVVGRLVGNTTFFSAPTQLQAGVSDYQVLDGTRNRWGDYSATSLDPADHKRFWTIQEFVSSTDRYATRVTEIVISDNPPPPPVPGPFSLLTPANGATNVPTSTSLLDWSDSSGAVSYTFTLDDNSDFSSPISNLVTGSSQVNVSPGTLQQSTTYYWKVVAANGFGNTTSSTPVSASFTTESPAQPCYSDANGDGTINTVDLTLLLGFFGQAVAPGTFGDADLNGIINTADLVTLLGRFGQNCP